MSNPPLSTLLPKIILGGGVYNTQMNPDPTQLPVRALISRAFALGLTAIDTSPYYGPSETLIGDALSQPAITQRYSRGDYILMTKVGRVAAEHFDYSPSGVRRSVKRSLDRLRTPYLDVVFCHDVEFVSFEEMLAALETLWELVAAGVVRYVGISGYPPEVLAERAVRVSRLGRRLDVVQSYAHFNLQNDTLRSHLRVLREDAGVECVLNSSPLGMKLLTGTFPGSFHPAPPALLEACRSAAEWVSSRGHTLPEAAMRFAFARWLALKDVNGGGVTISGASYVEELEANVGAFRDVVGIPEGHVGEGIRGLGEVDIEKVARWEEIWKGVRERLGKWLGWSWESPPRGWWEKRSKL